MDRSWWLDETDPQLPMPTAARSVLTEKGRLAVARARRPAWTIPGDTLLEEARKARKEIGEAERKR
jgi:hypothetical protein